MKECYIDMHCHILPGVDDGAKDLAETKKMLEIAYADGIRCIIATPHHHPHRGKAPAEKLRERAKLVREAAHEIDERFRVYLGTEVYFGQDVAKILKNLTKGDGFWRVACIYCMYNNRFIKKYIKK